jgi:hypothetical protein
MAVVLRLMPVTAEDLVRSWTAPCETGYVETSIENGIFLSTLNVPRRYHSTNAPNEIVFVFLYCYKQDKQPGNFQAKQSCLLCRGPWLLKVLIDCFRTYSNYLNSFLVMQP